MTLLRRFLLPLLLLTGCLAATGLGSEYLAAPGLVVHEPPSTLPPYWTPSPALVVQLQNIGPSPQNWPFQPEWTTVTSAYALNPRLNNDGSIPLRYRVDIPVGEADLYGTGEQTGPLRRNDQIAFLYANDNYAYARGPNLYQTHPWVLGVRPDGSAFGLLADTSARGEIDLRHNRVRMDFEVAPFRLLAIEKSSPQEVLHTLAELTGRMELPPKWALGYQQCRYSYMDDAEIRSIADNFRSRQLPCDVIWFDIDYMDGFRIFTFNRNSFPDPAATNNYLHERGFHSVWMINPAPKAEPGYFVFQQMLEQGLYVKKGTPSPPAVPGLPADLYLGEVWPGWCGFPDFTRPDTQTWWGSLYAEFLTYGVDGVWNDMNEPAIFNGGPLNTMPDDCQHQGGLALANGILPPGQHVIYHNLYGMLMIKATREGILAARPERRPFVLSRANHLGGQRYGATWTGDNISSYEHLYLATPMCLNIGLSGQPFIGPDLGGFAGNSNPTLFARWIGVGAFYPFMRGHSAKDTNRKEPWAFGPFTEEASRIALQRRYRLLPYLYTCFWEASRSGLPIMRPVFLADPTDRSLRSEENAFLFGPDLLIVPSWASPAALPRGAWKSLPLVTGDDGAYHPAVRLRPGALVAVGPEQQYVDQSPLDPLTLYVNFDGQGEAHGNLYEDEGDGFAYREGGYRRTTWKARKRSDGQTVLEIPEREGNWPEAVRSVQIAELTGDRQVVWHTAPLLYPWRGRTLDYGNGFRWNPLLGYFYDELYPFLFVYRTGSWLWIAPAGASELSGLYFWDFQQQQWGFSTAATYPYYFAFGGQQSGQWVEMTP